MAKSDIEEHLETIVYFLDKMNKRDRLRTIGGFFRGLLGLIPIAIMILSIWYFYEYGDELMATMAEQAASQAAKFAQQGGESMMQNINVDDLMKQFGGGLPQ